MIDIRYQMMFESRVILLIFAVLKENSRKSSVKVARLSRVWATLPTLTFLAVTGLWPERSAKKESKFKPVNDNLVGNVFRWYLIHPDTSWY